MVPRYSRPEMTAIWSAENRYRIWWQIEVFAADAMVKIGMIPADDAKTRLQEHLQANGNPLPVYAVKRTSGEPHAQIFLVSCAVPHVPIETEGEGPSRRRAEQVAALAALQALGLNE